MSKNSFGNLVFFAALAILLGRVEAWAQTTATISGTVIDQSRGVIVGAQITITNSETGQIRTVKTNEVGVITLPR